MKHTKPKEDGRLARGELTREKVLDAAERLFAEHGFEGVSIRDIAREAVVSLSVVGFHGGSKDDLFLTIFQRRAETLNYARREALAELRAHKGDALTRRDILEAYVLPYSRMAWSGDRQWAAYAKLIARIATDERWYPRVRDLFDPIAQEFLAAMLAVDPDAPRDRLAMAFVVSVTAMLSVVSSNMRIRTLSSALGTEAPSDPAWFNTVLIDICEGGFENALRVSDGAR
jgi:AcrR family transcriptional regulator